MAQKKGAEKNMVRGKVSCVNIYKYANLFPEDNSIISDYGRTV
ncbi:hypothetical protein NTE_00396 [Candidatus Nitrososphaera evergladensis SR1]|uniref:Uncharacterized protein n=1 Tax=Candidatus Nitrososphaera evergladensis SR1 TaxID=1459636 RepID=A0A075MMK1_9ARCH|nr:hypothetical protein NTE_00396 [Candidatus Nitrososphaera evergladensis SR1]